MEALDKNQSVLVQAPKSTVYLSCLLEAAAGVLRGTGFLRIRRSLQSRRSTKMAKNNETKNRKSRYNPNRTCYLSEDGKYYCFKVWDADAKTMVVQKLEVGKDLSVEWTLFLDRTDHDEDLNDRYQNELRDPLFETKVARYKSDPDAEDAVDPWDTVGDKKNSVEAALFAEPEPENPEISVARSVIDRCTTAQQDLIYRHFGMCEQLEAIRHAEAKQTGKLPSCVAMTNRKNKILDKVAKALGVERKGRCRQPKKTAK